MGIECKSLPEDIFEILSFCENLPFTCPIKLHTKRMCSRKEAVHHTSSDARRSQTIEQIGTKTAVVDVVSIRQP